MFKKIKNAILCIKQIIQQVRLQINGVKSSFFDNLIFHQEYK